MATSTKKAGTTRRKRAVKRWSADVTDQSVFTWKDPRRIARSLRHSAEVSHRRKSDPYRSAMSMLTFYINRAGDNLGAGQRRVLERAKAELRATFGKDQPRARAKSATRSRAAKKTGGKKSRTKKPVPRKR
jgi:Protein of unknown function (DUF3175)